MVNTYDIFMDGSAVGTATLEKEGLFWKICCCCDLSPDTAYRVVIAAGEKIDLGILVPEDNGLCLTKRIAMKRLGDKQPSFSAIPRVTQKQKHFVAITEDEPFAYIDKLQDSHLEEVDGMLGITVEQTDLDQPTPVSYTHLTLPTMAVV